MTDAKPPDAPAAPAEPAEDQASEGRLGTILMAVAIGGIVVLALDVAFKGKLLAPLFALLPAPKSSTVPEESGDGGLPDAAG